MGYKKVENYTLDNPTSKFKKVENYTLDEPEGEPGFLERSGKAIGKRVENVKTFAKKQKHPIIEAPTIGTIALGQAAAGLGDIIGEGVVSTYKSIVPEKKQEAIKNILVNFLQTGAGKKALGALKAGAGTYEEFEKSDPDSALALSSMLGIFGLTVGTKATKLTADEIIDVGKDVAALTRKAAPKNPKSVDWQSSQITRKGIEKGIGPSTVKGRTATQADRFFESANNAVKTIIDNKSILGLTDDMGEAIKDGLPTNLKQFTHAISNTKKAIFEQYDKIAKLSGEKGALVELNGVAKQLDTIINNKGMTPEIKEYAQKQKDELLDMGSFTTVEAQTRIQVLNNKLGSMTDYNSVDKIAVDQMIANNLRKSLNDVVEETTGQQYAQLKRKYGALTEIERDVNRKAFVDARKNVKGLIDFTDVFTGGEVVAGIVSMQPHLIMKGMVGKTIASITKSLNDPNRRIKNMFKETEQVVEKGKAGTTPFEPKSAILKKFVGLNKDAKNRIRADMELNARPFVLEKAVEKEVKKQATGRPLIQRGPGSVKSKAPKKVKSKDGPPLKRTQAQIAKEVEETGKLKRLDQLFAESNVKRKVGPSLIQRGVGTARSSRPLSVEQRLKNLRR